MDDSLAQLLRANGGVLVRRDHPELAATLDWLIRTDRLVRVLPGIYTTPTLAASPAARMRAACASDPDAVLVGATAARASYWPAAPTGPVEVALPRRREPQASFTFLKRQIPPELIEGTAGLRWTTPALTALDVATTVDANAIDIALRTRRATLAAMYGALQATPARAGNADRRRLLLDSRDEPWSEAERRAHRLLRAAHLTGWRSNRPVMVGGRLYYIDIAFGASMLAVEIDGRLHELDKDLFESDRWRQNALVRAGWRVLRFTWTMLVDHPELVVQEIRAGLRDGR